MQIIRFFKIYVIFTMFFSGYIYSQDLKNQGAGNDLGIYLKCNADNDTGSVNDVYINFKDKTITDFFGISTKYREENQFIIAEKFIDVGSNKTLSSETRINKYTLEFTRMHPVLNLITAGKCARVSKQF